LLVRLARPGRRWTDSDAHRLFLVSRDHFYDSSRVWRMTGLSRPAPMSDRFEACTEWYRRVIRQDAAA
jgi:hypothetical protein